MFKPKLVIFVITRSLLIYAQQLVVNVVQRHQVPVRTFDDINDIQFFSEVTKNKVHDQ